MSDAISVSAPISGTDSTLSFEAGKLAQLADGAVVGRIGDTVLLATATAARSVREGADFFPLTVDIEERTYAAGKIPGSFFRREGKSSDQAILTCRLIDRPLRPSFPKGFRNEVHIVGTIFGADQVNPHDVLAINAASAALMLSGIPFEGPIGAVRVAYSTDGQWIPHPTFEEGDESTFELVVAGRALAEGADAEIAIMMVEAGGSERLVPVLRGGRAPGDRGGPGRRPRGGQDLDPGVDRAPARAGRRLRGRPGPDRDHRVLDVQPTTATTSWSGWRPSAPTDLAARPTSSPRRPSATPRLDEATAVDHRPSSAAEFPDRAGEIKAAVRSLTKKLVRKRIVEEGLRIDGRTTTDIRPAVGRGRPVPDRPRLGAVPAGRDPGAQRHHPGHAPHEPAARHHHPRRAPSATCTTTTSRPSRPARPGSCAGPKRREIGHGLLAERALLPVVPYQEDFPYTLRLVSDVLSSNGSTSMASVCGSTLSMMAAGVPLKAPVAGIAMGLVYDGGTYVTLTDILGAEDAFGDMDFKVAGTRDVVTALQLDTKIDGLPARRADQGAHPGQGRPPDHPRRHGRRHRRAPRPRWPHRRPKIISFEIPMDKIGEVIGPKGKVINALQQETGADIAVDDDGMVGTVTIGAKDGTAVEEAQRRISTILDPPLAEVGAVYPGKVVNITKFGAFVNILPGRDGLLHISKMGQGKRVERVEDVFELGQPVEVKVDDIDPQGKVSLSLAGEALRRRRARRARPARRDRRGRRARNGGGRAARSRGDHADPDDDSDRGPRRQAAPSAPAGAASFEDAFEEELVQEFGDLGPAVTESSDRPSGGGGGRGGRRRR